MKVSWQGKLCWRLFRRYAEPHMRADCEADRIALKLAGERRARAERRCPNHLVEEGKPLCAECLQHALETGAYL
jgi:hypothetical protein